MTYTTATTTAPAPTVHAIAAGLVATAIADAAATAAGKTMEDLRFEIMESVELAISCATFDAGVSYDVADHCFPEIAGMVADDFDLYTE